MINLQVKSLLSNRQFEIMKITVKDVSESLTKGIYMPFGFLLTPDITFLA